MIQNDDVKAIIKAYVLEAFLPGEDPDELDGSTPLITGGILDSISTVKLVAFLEARFRVEFHAHEMSPEYLNTIDLIAQTVEAKQ